MLDLLAVLDTFGPRAATVPLDTRQAIALVRGAIVPVRVRLLLSNGIIAPKASATLVLRIRKSASDKLNLVNLDLAAGADGYWTGEIAAATLARVAPGAYVYEVWYTSATVKAAVLPLSSCKLLPSVAA